MKISKRMLQMIILIIILTIGITYYFNGQNFYQITKMPVNPNDYKEIIIAEMKDYKVMRQTDDPETINKFLNLIGEYKFRRTYKNRRFRTETKTFTIQLEQNSKEYNVVRIYTLNDEYIQFITKDFNRVYKVMNKKLAIDTIEEIYESISH